MRKTAFFALGSGVYLLFAFLFPPFINQIEAQVNSVKIQAPTSTELNQAFSIQIEVNAKADTLYYLKARLGPASNSLAKGQTYNESAGVWLSDQIAWSQFPQINTDANGVWSGSLQARNHPSASTGPNFLAVRLREVSSDDYTDSQLASLELTVPLPVTPPSQPKFDPKNISLNELLPNPTSGEEWVELFNKGTLEVDLTGWKIADDSSPTNIPAGSKIGPKSFLVLNFKSKFNNSGDSVKLISDQDTVIEEFSYTQTTKGESFAKDSGGKWFLTESPTPGAVNPNPPPASNNSKSSKTTTGYSNSADKPADTNTQISSLPAVLGTSDATTSPKALTKSAAEEKVQFNYSLVLIGLGVITLILGAGFLVYEHLYKKGRAAASEETPAASETD